MTIYAFDDVDDAIAATKALLWPFDLRRWAKLALVVFFLGGVGGFNPFSFTSGPPTGGPGTGPGTPGASGGLPSLGGTEVLVIAAIVGIIVMIGLLFAVVGSIMEFVFLESLRRETVAIRRYWSEHWGRGLRLFAFRLVFGFVSLAVAGILVVIALYPLLVGDAGFSVALFLLVVPVFLVLAVVAGLIGGFTTVFVAPVMLLEERGVLSAWGRFWPTLRGQWKQYLAYAVMGFVLQLAAGFVVTILMIVVAILVAIPFVIVGLGGAALLSVSEVAGWVVIGLLVALYVLLMIVAALLSSVPIQAFLRYYALLVLGDTDDDFDLIPDRRAAIRADGGETDAAVDDGVDADDAVVDDEDGDAGEGEDEPSP